MKVKIKRIDQTLDLPKYQTEGSVFFDLSARENVLIKPGEMELIPLNIVVEVPEGYMFLLSSRSSTSMKKGLLAPNGVGVIDQDYCGDDDEVKLIVYNFTEDPVFVARGERIAQAGFIAIGKVAKWQEVETMLSENRGGFGSTGV